MSVYPDVFLITSVINTGTNPWSYCATRSVFNTQRRFEQTLKTIESIRNLKDDTIIVLSECSQLDSEMTESLIEKTDIFMNCYNDEYVKEACIQSNKKGYGEILQIQYALNKLSDSNIQFHRLFKISGRYWLNKSFKKESFSSTFYTFNKTFPNAQCNSTVLYSVPNNLSEHYRAILSNCDNIYRSQTIGLEVLMPPLCVPKIEIDCIGVSGYVAVDGGYYTIE
jgi:hypothetical protein